MARYGNCKCRICTGPEMMRDDLDLPQMTPQEAHSVDSDAAALPDDPNAINLAIDVLTHIHEWATLDPEGQQYRWIAIRTAAALAALEAGS